MRPAAAAGGSPIEIGWVDRIYRYPIKSMRGEELEAATLGWHGVEGDRRLALRRLDERGGFPWLTAGRYPELIGFSPLRGDGADGDALPTHVRTLDGSEFAVFDRALADHVARRHGAPVEMMRLNHGIFDESALSLITTDTVREIGSLSGTAVDARRFRPNVVVRASAAVAFAEDAWVGGVLTFGDDDGAPAMTVTMRDVRCGMVNLDPDGGAPWPAVLKAVVRANANTAGVYGTVSRPGRVAVGQPIRLWR